MELDDLIQNIGAIEKQMEDISLEDAIDRQIKHWEDAMSHNSKLWVKDWKREVLMKIVC